MVAALSTVAWWFGQFPYIVRRTSHSELGPTCESRLCHAFIGLRRRPASTSTSAPGHIFLLLTLHKLFIMQRFIIIIIIIISGLHYFLCTGKWSSRTITFDVTSARRGASSTLHYPMPGTSASLCRPALTVLCHHFGVLSSLLRHLGTGLGDGTLSRIKLGPRHQYRTH